MAVLTIPEGDRPGITFIRDLGEVQFAELLIELEKNQTETPIVEGIGFEESDAIWESLKSMYRTRIYAEVPVEEFVTDILDSLRESRLVQPNQERQLRERLLLVLDIEPLNIQTKAVLLRLENEHRYCSARIISDVRPIFGSDPAAPPLAVMIGHTLRIAYHEDEDLREIYFALRPHDLKELQNAMNRAVEKEKSLQATLSAANVKIVEGRSD